MDYLQKAKEIISGCLLIPVEKIPNSGTLNDIQPLDSLSFENMVTEMEKTVGHEIDAMDLLEIRSVESMAALLKKEMT
ncbi:Acyl carrier protein [Saezia sanguinis]|jgi:acyl carrier protein|uniref:Acyl carrier protein n=1 Tax=Saezia sanguinis TaxID=1965230 RepID=A0A433SAR0_9BURK|nr:acyl carrier protein [Saezia sanguinis]RUS65836.1 Acyl carrier protein [Saezia sanguinis]